MGFAEHYIHMIWNLLANNWYSVLVNGHFTGFFKSTRGVNKGDPLSPALFILFAEVLTRSMNILFDDKRFVGYGMAKWTDPLNHLAYANDTIIFASADIYSLNKIVEDKYFKVLVQSLDFKERFRTSKSFWSNFIWNKYCKKDIPTTVYFNKGYHVWKKMLEAREGVEHEILWEMNKGSTNVWYENWTRLGSLYHVVPTDFNINEDLQEVVALRDEDTWNDKILIQNFPEDIADYIKHEIYFDKSAETWDTPKWMPTALGKFTLSSAWQLLKHSHRPNHEYKHLWTKGLPFKISFFLWRLWKGKVPIDDT
ncbi:uncharacterized protein [Nicotiana tomentosiformis]|uniref:uncharacterized protein n=1 Tax=Nicotiana tomentosiformis TaxID=4098 RepID=UPI00388CC22C